MRVSSVPSPALAAAAACAAVLAAGVLSSCGCAAAAGSPSPRGGVSIVSYNVMTLFDARDDGGEYEDFSVARGLWDEARYKARLELTADAILASCPGSSPPGPDILCLIEAEGPSVLEDLRTGPLSKARYRYSASADKEGGPFANGVLSRFPILGAAGHSASLDGARAGRDTLEVELDIGGSRLALFVCHWKSKVGGARETEEARRGAAALLRGRAAEILAADPGAELIACGDFNENPDEFARAGGAYPTALVRLEDAAASPGGVLVASDIALARAEGDPVLYSPWEDWGGYSYSYRGLRERIDGFLLGPGLRAGRGGLRLELFSVSDAPFLVDREGDPVPWNGSARTGYSDHLPIVLRLGMEPE